MSLALTHLLIGITKIIKLGVSRWSVPLVGWIGIAAVLFGCCWLVVIAAMYCLMAWYDVNFIPAL